jgi:hypothetical protein
MSHARASRGYALILVLMVLALLSVGLGTLFAYQEGSARTTGSLLERRRVFYACDGIGRAATVLAQRYMTTAAPTTQGLIDDVCATGGGGCCATETNTATDPSAGACQTRVNARFTRLEAPPSGAGPSALPLITPDGFKIMELAMASTAPSCTGDAQCPNGTCVAGFCRTVAPLPNGPFEGMNARQDTITLGVVAEHNATTQFRCATEQTLTLGKIAMFQFFLFSDMAYTDWHPGPLMRTSGRMHANGNLRLDGAVRIARVTAAGDIGCNGAPPNVSLACNSSTTRISNVASPTANEANFQNFVRNAAWATEALNTYNHNAQDRAHGVPRLQLPIVGDPEVQRGTNAAGAATPNANVVTIDGVPRTVANSRLLIDPVRPNDSLEIAQQKFAHKADIRIINGVWYLRDPANPDVWPGTAIWSDHGGRHFRTAVDDLKRATDAEIDVGQPALEASSDLAWAGRVPQRYSYYGSALGQPRLARDLDTTAAATVRPPAAQRAVVSYGALFRDASAGQHASVYRPGFRSLESNGRIAFCSRKAAADHVGTPTIVDAMRFDVATPPSCRDGDPEPGLDGVSQAAALLAATRSGFRDGWREIRACGDRDKNNENPTNCDGGTDPDRRDGNVLPMNFDIFAFQEALADITPGELGSFFVGREFNGIVWIGAPYPGSENGYGTLGGIARPTQPPAPTANPPAHLGSGRDNATLLRDTPAINNHNGDPADANPEEWTTGKSMPLLVDALGRESRDDEVAALPFPLCSDETAPSREPGSDMTSRGGITFRRPDCNDEATYTRINGIRIINARRLNSNLAPTVAAGGGNDGDASTDADNTIADAIRIPGNGVGANSFANIYTDPPLPETPPLVAVGRLPNGLTVVSNLPVYLLGDANITSDAFAPNTEPGTHWVPFLVGGDVVHPLSNAWDDRNARWALSNGRGDANHRNPRRHASVTRWYIEMLSGWGPSEGGGASGGIHNFPRKLEDWRTCAGIGGNFSGDCPAIIVGSLIIGHAQVYSPPFSENDTGRNPPRRDWGFDEHLSVLDNQPPGAPLFDVAAIRQWKRN